LGEGDFNLDKMNLLSAKQNEIVISSICMWFIARCTNLIATCWALIVCPPIHWLSVPYTHTNTDKLDLAWSRGLKLPPHYMAQSEKSDSTLVSAFGIFVTKVANCLLCIELALDI
jgi:hypothetical protein